MPPIVRSILAILAGYATMAAIVIVLTLFSMKVFSLQSGHPTPVYLALNVVYSAIAAGLGGYVAAAIGCRSPVVHGLVLAALMLALSVVSFNTSSAGQPFGYRVFLVAVLPLAAIAGAALRGTR